MMRHMLPAALIGAVLITGCAQTGPKTPVQALAGAGETLAWRPFSTDSPWNTKIAPDAPTDPNSNALITDLAAINPLHISITEWSVAVYEVDQKKTPKHYVQALYEGQHGPGFGPTRRVPIPAGATAAGPDMGTGYLAVVDKAFGKAWEMRQAGQYPESDLWFTGFGAEVDLNGTGVNLPWMKAKNPLFSKSPRASGAPLIAGLIRLDEVKAGRIDHALAFAYPNGRTNAFISPASTALDLVDGRTERTSGLPMGARIQLDPAFDVDASTLTPAGKVIARALQEYGAILVDEAGGTVLYAEAGPDQLAGWQGVLGPTDLQDVFTPEMMAKHFRVLEIGEIWPGKPRETAN